MVAHDVKVNGDEVHKEKTANRPADVCYKIWTHSWDVLDERAEDHEDEIDYWHYPFGHGQILIDKTDETTS